jgi:hypothetical protein
MSAHDTSTGYQVLSQVGGIAGAERQVRNLPHGLEPRDELLTHRQLER